MKVHTLNKIMQMVKSVIRVPRKKKRGRPFKYSIRSVAVFFYAMVLKKIAHFKTMHRFLVNDPSFASSCGFKESIPDRTTMSRRFKHLYDFVKAHIRHMGKFLGAKKVTTSYISSVDSTMHKACGNIWHRKHKKQNYIPPKLRNIDKDADWGNSEYKNWVYGYKTHLISTSSFHKVAVPVYCEITPGNNSDCKTAKGIFREFWPKKMRYLLGDKGYDDKTLRSMCSKAKALLITPMRRHENMNPERKRYLKIYKSKLGRSKYSRRSKTIEPLFGHIKELFDIEKLKTRGLKNVQTFLSLCIWIYQTLIYYNFINQRPLRRLKDLVCAV